MTGRDTLPVLRDSEDSRLKKQEIIDSLRQQATEGNVVAVAALERLEKDSRYLSLLAGMDDDEDSSVALAD